MKREKAQHILLAYRLGEAVPSPSELEEALALAAEDPALGAWLEQELVTDRVIRSKLREVRPPVGLKERIRLGSRRIEVAWWQKPAVWAAAAAIAFLMGASVWWVLSPSVPSRSSAIAVNKTPTSDLQTFRTEMMHFVSRGEYSLQMSSGHFAEVKRHLSRNGSAAGQITPAELAKLATHGCQIFEWNGATITLICFQASDLGIVHFFVVDARALKDPPGSIKEFSPVESWASACWRDGDMAVLVVSPAAVDDLRRFLRG